MSNHNEYQESIDETLRQDGLSLPETAEEWKQLEREMEQETFTYEVPDDPTELLDNPSRFELPNTEPEAEPDSPMSLAARNGNEALSPEILARMEENRKKAQSKNQKK